MTSEGRNRFALWWLIAPLAAVFAYRSVTGFDFVADARFLILENTYIRGLNRFVPNVLHDYFWSSSGNQIPYWRPITKGSWVLEHLAFGDWAGGFMLVQLGWHVLGVLGVQALARSMGLGRGSAVVAGLVFALHPVAIEPVAMIMARSDVVASSGVIGSLVSWFAWRRTRQVRWLLLHVLAIVFAMGSKEQAAFLPALLAIRLLTEGAFGRERWRALLPVMPSVVVLFAYLVARHAVLAGAGMPSGTLAPDPMRILAGMSIYLTNTWPLALSSSVRDISLAEAHSVGFLMRAVLVLGVVAVLAIHSARKADADALSLLAWALLALSPVLLTRDIFVPTEQAKYAFADRWLAHALAPSALLWMHMLRGLGPRAERAMQGACAGWALVMLLGSTHARAEFATELAMLDNEDRVFWLSVPQQFRTDEDRCRYKQRRVARASLLQDFARVPDRVRDAMAVCGDRPELALELLRALVATRRFAEADFVAERLLDHPPSDHRSHADIKRLAVIAHANRHEAPSAAQPAPVDCRAFINRAEDARRLGRPREGAALLLQAFTCGNQRDASLLVAAATWLIGAGDAAAAQAVLDALKGRALTDGEAAQVESLRGSAHLE